MGLLNYTTPIGRVNYDIVFVMPNPKDIFSLMNHAPTDEEKELISQAHDFAEKAHSGQLRASGDPYFFHVFETARNLARFGMDSKTIAAGLLHDTLEDTEVTEAEMKKEFGDEITSLVKGTTKLGKLKYRGEERHVESLRKFFIAMAQDLRVLIIKLADRLHNLQTLQYLREDKAKRIALESIQIHAALANRLGMGKLKGELEDLAFPFAYPKEAEMVETILKEKTGINQKNLEEIHEELCLELKKAGIKDFKTDFRMKHKYSLYKKLKKYDMSSEKIYDIVALRVIVQTVEDCYRVLGIVHSLWNPLPGRIKDYIALPKPNGYQSLHTTIFTGTGAISEIQIRTFDMHREAEYGVASHFIYKENDQKNPKQMLKKKFAWIGELKELQKVVAEPGKFLENLKMDFFKDRIFIYTPKGDVIDLPEDSSPIDFAYAVHSHIGNHAAGATINGKYSALKTKLKSGDIVQIDTKESAHPTSSWLEYTKTTMAKKHIRAYIQEHSIVNSLLKRFRG